MITERIKNIKASSTVAMAAKAIALKEEGHDIIDFSVGEPDFPTPQYIKQAAVKAIAEERTKYTVNNGMLTLREAIATKLQTENNVQYTPDEIIVSCGAKHSLFNVMLSIISPGDEVIIPAPYWPSYVEITHLAQGKAVIVPTAEADGFCITPAQLEKALTPKTRLFILCNPTNPSGAGYSREQLSDLSQVLAKKNILIIADEIYEKLFYDGLQYTSLASLSEELRKKTIIINGLSKAYAMTGWRVGYAAGPAEIIQGASKIQSHSTSAASTISQYAALAALSGPQEEMHRMVDEFQKRRDYLVDAFRKIPGITCNQPQGAFYIFPNISFFFGKKYKEKMIKDSVDFANYLLEEAKVVLVPGAGFGAPEYIRLSYSTAMKNLEEGVVRIEEALKKLITN